MYMRKLRFINNDIYHIYNRGVEKRNVFQDSGDYIRFIHHLFEFNNMNKTRNLTYHLGKKNINNNNNTQHELLVNILAFVLMPNHYHLLLQQKVENGVSTFMHKLGTGYTMFFNEKNERSGILFQGRFKAVHIENNIQLRYIPHYIHLNPLALTTKANTLEEKISYLQKYKWSSFPDYVGKRNFPSVTQRDYFLNIFEGNNKYLIDIKKNITNKPTINTVDNSILLDYSH